MNKKEIIKHLESMGLTFVAFFIIEIGALAKDLNIQMLSWSIVGAIIVSALRAAFKELYFSALKPLLLKLIERFKV